MNPGSYGSRGGMPDSDQFAQICFSCNLSDFGYVIRFSPVTDLPEDSILSVSFFNGIFRKKLPPLEQGTEIRESGSTV
jgi:hypothetical protein